VDTLLQVKIPLLAISAQDDPIVDNAAIPYEEFESNPYAILCATSMGGHLGWFQLGGTRWFAQAAAAFLRKFDSDIDTVATASINTARNQNDVPVGDGPQFDPLRRRLHDPAMESRSQL